MNRTGGYIDILLFSLLLDKRSAWMACINYFSYKCGIVFSLECNLNCRTATMGQTNRLGLRQNGWRFTEDIFKYIFLYESCSILIPIHLQHIAIVPRNDDPALVPTMILAMSRGQADIWSNVGLVQQRIYLPLAIEYIISYCLHINIKEHQASY